MANESQTMLDEDALGEVAVTVPAKDNDGVPYCPTHHCRMVMASGAGATKGKDYYRCKVDECKETGIRVRTTKNVVPDQPQKCAKCGTVCKANSKLSNHAAVVLSCPECGWSLPPIVRPGYAAMEERRYVREPVADIGSRK